MGLINFVLIFFLGGVFEDVEEHAAGDERGVLDVRVGGTLDAAVELEVVESEEER